VSTGFDTAIERRLQTLDRRLRRGATWLRSDRGARWTFVAALIVSVGLLYVVGRRQWFIRDDWAFVLTRDKVHRVQGLGHMLFEAQDGHWMTFPIIIFRAVHAMFGIDSYWPYLIPMMLCHLATAVMVRVLCRRAGASAWTATILASMLAVFGSGWENIVFAVQIVYNLSLLAFLVQLLLIDHDGPLDRRDVAAALLGVIAVASSGFGPFFIVGVFVFMVVRRRWGAALVAVVPAAVAEGWWWVFWGRDPAGDSHRGPITGVPAYVNRGVEGVFQGITSLNSLVGISLIGTLAVLVWRRRDPRTHDLLFAMAVTALGIDVGLAIQRGGFGIETAANSRYVYIGAVLLMPAFAVAVDQTARLSPALLWAARLVLIGAIGMNIGALRSNGAAWADRAQGERNLFALVAGSPATANADPRVAPAPFSPDVRVADLPTLVAGGAITPRPPATPQEQQLVDAALSQQPVP
jgi:hypothetical protein